MYFLFIRKWIQGGQFHSNVRIDGKVVIVTGCNTGIGRETVLDLAGRGAHIHMACRDYKRCEITRQESHFENIFVEKYFKFL